MTKTETVFVALLDEDVSVWRPAPAIHLEDDRYILLRPDDYDPQDEHWEYPPGTVVECELRRDEEGDRLSAVRRAMLTTRIA